MHLVARKLAPIKSLETALFVVILSAVSRRSDCLPKAGRDAEPKDLSSL